MAIQSPKSQRPKAPGEKPSDSGSQETFGGTHPEGHASGSPSSPRVPGGLKHSGGRHQGNEPKVDQSLPVGPTTPHQGGGPGFAKGKGDGERRGGTVHQT